MSLPRVDGLLTKRAQERLGDSALVVESADGYVLHLSGQPFIVLASHPLDDPKTLFKHARNALNGLCKAQA